MNKHQKSILPISPERWGNQDGYYNEADIKVAEGDVELLIRALADHMQEHAGMIENILATLLSK